MNDRPDRPTYPFDFHGTALDDIFDDYTRMHDGCPVAWSDRHGGFWAISRYDDVQRAEHDWDTYSVTPSMILPSFATERPMIPLDIDPPALTAYRHVLLPFFTPARVELLTPRAHQLAGQLLDDYGDADVIDVSRYARLLPTMLFSEYAGFPLEDAAQFDVWVEDIVFARTDDASVARKAADDVYAYFIDLIATRRQQLLASRRNDPGGAAERRGADSGVDVISGLLTAELNGRGLTDDEMLDICYLLFMAGLETTAGSIRASLWHLAQHPDDLAVLVADPTLIRGASEEFLRTLSPVQAMARTLKQDTVVGGVALSAGERVALVFGAANRDPQRFDAPNEIRMDRVDNPHVAFGLGAHRCLGSNLARRELVVGLTEFLARYPRFELAEPAPWHGIGPLHLRITRPPPAS